MVVLSGEGQHVLCPRVAIMCPMTSFSPGLYSLSVFLMDLTMTRYVRVRVLALFSKGLIVENCNDCKGAESSPLGDIVVQFGMMTSEPGSISSERGSSTLRGTVQR
jgi:hypothetical protein